MKKSIHSSGCTRSFFTSLWYSLNQVWCFLLSRSGHEDDAQLSSPYRMQPAYCPGHIGLYELINRHWAEEPYRARGEGGNQAGFAVNVNGGVYGFGG